MTAKGHDRCLLAPQLCARLVRELRVLALTGPGDRLPPPSDVEAEQDVVAAVLTAAARPRALDLHPSDVIVPLHREVLRAATELDAVGAVVNLSSIAAQMTRSGVHLPDLEGLLAALECTTPYIGGPDFEHRVARVRERAAARALCRHLIGLDAMLRADLIRAREARERLALIASEVTS